MRRNSRIGKLSMFLSCLNGNFSCLIMFVKMFCLCFASFFYLFDLIGNLAHDATSFSFVNEPLF
jgi:hypothetical protein